MRVFTDSVGFAEKLLGKDLDWKTERKTDEGQNGDIRILIESLIPGEPIYSVEIDSRGFWKYILLVEKAPESQYDVLIRLVQDDWELPDGVLCIADQGSGFHGLKNRAWKRFFNPHSQLKALMVTSFWNTVVIRLMRII